MTVKIPGASYSYALQQKRETEQSLNGNAEIKNVLVKQRQSEIIKQVTFYVFPHFCLAIDQHRLFISVFFAMSLFYSNRIRDHVYFVSLKSNFHSSFLREITSKVTIHYILYMVFLHCFFFINLRLGFRSK